MKTIGFTGRHHTKESREKTSKSLKGRIFTEEHKRKIGLKSKNRIVSELTRKKLSLSKIKHGKYITQNYCIDCNKEIYPTSIRCKKCMGIKNRGINNPNYINGNERYNLEFTLIRPFILKRDNYTCQNCNMTQEEHYIIYGRDIEVHHIDYDKKNCKENNLITLCKQCNIRANYNREYWKDYFKEKKHG